jgi:hypothetical protein
MFLKKPFTGYYGKGLFYVNGVYPFHLKMQDSAGIINVFRQGID